MKIIENFYVLVKLFPQNRIFIEFFFLKRERERVREKNQIGFIDIDLN